MSATLTLSLSEHDAAAILHAYDDGFNELLSLTEWTTLSSSTKTYTTIYTTILTAAPLLSAQVKTETDPIPSSPSKKIIITLASSSVLDTIASLHSTLSTRTSLSGSIPLLLKRDDTRRTLASSSYTLHAHPPGVPLTSLSTSLPEHDQIRIMVDLRLGALMKEVHEQVQNDWFGVPGEEKEWGECYSWQEAFTTLLETALDEVEQRERARASDAEGEIEPRDKKEEEISKEEYKETSSRAEDFEKDGNTELPLTPLRLLLSRAIGSFLFDDVEVPSLIWTPSPAAISHSRIFIHPPSSKSSSGAQGGEITTLLGWECSLWGDPLLEGEFQNPPGPSKAFLEGYGGSPIVFARQNTKRLWYSVYVALLSLIQTVDARDEEREKEERRRIWEMVERLEGAPCY